MRIFTQPRADLIAGTDNGRLFLQRSDDGRPIRNQKRHGVAVRRWQDGGGRKKKEKKKKKLKSSTPAKNEHTHTHTDC